MTNTQHSSCSPHSPLPSLIKTNIPLADKNWFATGGCARYFAQPNTADEFRQALVFAAEHNLPIFVLGHGANILISDEGFDGLVIQSKLESISITDTENSDVYVTAGAGVAIPDLINWCLTHNLTGLEEFSGIPGTVGGSIYINLHYFQFFLEHFLVNAQIIDKNSGVISTVDPSWFNFGYNQSTLHAEQQYLINATFKLTRCTDLETAYARGRQTEIIRHRASRYPAHKTCGSFFRNFHPHEVTLESNGKKIIYTAYYLDKIGVKGALKIGGAVVSHQHANMIVNAQNATSNDIIMLARTMQEKIKEVFNIIPQPECRLIGFKKYPLL